MTDNLEQIKDKLKEAKETLDRHKWEIENQDIPDLTEIQSVISDIEDRASSLPNVEDVQRIDTDEVDSVIDALIESIDELDTINLDRNAFATLYSDGPALMNRAISYQIHHLIMVTNKLVESAVKQRFDGDSWQRLYRLFIGLQQATDEFGDKVDNEINTYGQPNSNTVKLAMYKED